MHNNKKHRPYVIYTKEFDEKTGGIIALHHLCDLLNSAGEKAYIWPTERFISGGSWISNILFFTKLIFKKVFFVKFKTFSGFHTPIASAEILRDAIVVYPEIVSGNPLGAKRVVRWFLNKPGYLTGKIEYGKNELYYFYAKHFNNSEINVDDDNSLKTLFIRDDVYRETPGVERRGTCYILRKGKGRRLVHDLSDSVLIDGLSHAQAAKVFNQSEFCISYDSYTMLSKYAAMCGCISIVIPKPGISKEQWRPDVNDRFGIAYGFGDIQWAKDTMNYVHKNFKDQQVQTSTQLERFIKKTQSKWWGQ